MAELFAGKEWQTFLQICPPFRLKHGRPSGPPSSQRCWRWSSVCRWASAWSRANRAACRPLPRWLMALLNGLVNLLRSVPFLI